MAEKSSGEKTPKHMGQSLDQILPQLKEGDHVGVTIASNQDNGIVGYAVGSLVFHPAVFNPVGGGPAQTPAHLSTVPGQELTFYFSDRKLDIDPPPPPGSFGNGARQPFNANATEKLGVSISLGVIRTMTLAVFNSQSQLQLQPMGDLLLGLGPSLGNSDRGVFVASFTAPLQGPR
jgi:hypothetical protein